MLRATIGPLRELAPDPLPVGSQHTPGITQGPARGGPAPLRSPRASRSRGDRAWGRRPLSPSRCGVMPERRTARRHRPRIGGRVRHRVVAEAKAYPDGVSTSNVLPAVAFEPAVGGTRLDRRTRVLVATPVCPAHFGGRRTRNGRSAGHGTVRASRWRACGCATASGAPTPVRAPWTWLGATPHLGVPRLAPGRMGPDSPIPPPLRGCSQPTVRPGRVSRVASKRWRPRCNHNPDNDIRSCGHARPQRVSIHLHPDFTCAPLDRHRARRTPIPNHCFPLEERQAPARAGRTAHLDAFSGQKLTPGPSPLLPDARAVLRATDQMAGGEPGDCDGRAEQDRPCELTHAQIVQSIVEGNRMMARTKRSRRSYGAGEWHRNRVRIFPALLTRSSN